MPASPTPPTERTPSGGVATTVLPQTAGIFRQNTNATSPNDPAAQENTALSVTFQLALAIDASGPSACNHTQFRGVQGGKSLDWTHLRIAKFRAIGTSNAAAGVRPGADIDIAFKFLI